MESWHHKIKEFSKMIEETHQITWVILKAAENIHTGKHKLAKFLKGSKAKDIAHLSNEQGYGGLLWFSMEEIVAFIEQLEDMGLIKRTSLQDYYSILELTDAGRKILNEIIKIQLLFVKKEKPLVVGDTERTTLELFKKGKSVPEIAYERKLAFSTIFEHMRKLLANGYVSSAEFVEQDKIDKILEARAKLKRHFRLKEIKEILPENVSYDEIKCVLDDKSFKIEDKNEQKDQLK